MTNTRALEALDLLKQAGDPATNEEKVARAQVLATLAVAEQLNDLEREVAKIDWRHKR